jgi:hypothetical protein
MPPVKPVKATDTTAKAPDMQTNSLLPFYPNATLYEDAGNTNSAVQSTSSSKSTFHIVMLQTTDKPEAVIDFYDKRLARSGADPQHPGRQVTQHPLRGERKQDGKAVVTLTDTRPDGVMFAVEVREDVGKTIIELMDIAAKQPLPDSIPLGAASTNATPTGTTPGASNDSSTDTPDPLKPSLPTVPH